MELIFDGIYTRPNYVHGIIYEAKGEWIWWENINEQCWLISWGLMMTNHGRYISAVPVVTYTRLFIWSMHLSSFSLYILEDIYLRGSLHTENYIHTTWSAFFSLVRCVSFLFVFLFCGVLGVKWDTQFCSMYMTFESEYLIVIIKDFTTYKLINIYFLGGHVMWLKLSILIRFDIPDSKSKNLLKFNYSIMI